MTGIDYLMTAKKGNNREKKTYWLFKFFEFRRLTKTKGCLREMVGWSDERLDREIESQIEFEKK